MTKHVRDSKIIDSQAIKKPKRQDIFSHAKRIILTQLGSELKTLEFPKPLNPIDDLKESRFKNWPVYKQIFENDLKGLINLFSDGEKSPFINGSRQEVSSPLFWACKLGNPDIVQFLLDKGADPQCLNEISSSPLIYVMQGGQEKILGILFTHSPRLLQGFNLQSWIYLVNSAFKYGHSHLLIDLGEQILKNRDENSLYIYTFLLYAKGCISLKPLAKEKFLKKLIELLNQETEPFLSYCLSQGGEYFLRKLFKTPSIFAVLKQPDKNKVLIKLACELNNENVLILILSRCPELFQVGTIVPNFLQLIIHNNLSFLKNIFKNI